MIGGYMTNLDNVYYQYRDGVVSEARWHLMLSHIRYFSRTPGFKHWWEQWDESTVAPQFVNIVRTEMEALEE